METQKQINIPSTLNDMSAQSGEAWAAANALYKQAIQFGLQQKARADALETKYEPKDKK